MSNWISITKADLYNSKVSALIDAADSVMLGDNQSDRTSGVIADVILEIRRRVSKCHQLDVDASKIPAGLKPLAVDIIFCRLKIALEMQLSQDERDALSRRQSELDRIADGKDPVETPDNPIPSAVNTAGAGVSSQAAPRRGKRKQMEGLI